ncbi:MAG: hypothetical protein RLZZ28_1225 [Bacteroidota bacterium]
MLGIIVQLALSWLIVWFFEKGNLSFLGLAITKKRVIDFFVFFLITAVCCSSGFLLRMYFGKEVWGFNPQLSIGLIFNGIWWNIKSVLYEELIFRGVFFYLLIKKIGPGKAILVSAICFGMYHWFSFEVLGDAKQMLISFVLTGVMGLLYAYGYSKTFSLYIPSAMHLGWNLTQGFMFSSGSIGKGVLVQLGKQPLVQVSYTVYFAILMIPLLSTWLINYGLLKKKPQVEISAKKTVNDN